MTAYVIKVGGALLENKTAMDAFFKVLKQLQQADIPLVLVHGGGALVEQLLTQLNMPSEKLNGLRVTPEQQIPYVTGALAGTANKQLMAAAISNQLTVCGLSLADGGLCECAPMAAELGAVGTATANDGSLVKALWSAGLLPIISSIGIANNGQLLNVNADQAAVAIAQLLGAELLLLSDVAGVLDANKQLLSSLNKEQIAKLIDADVIQGGMAVKVNAALDAANSIKNPVTISGWMQPEQLLNLVSNRAFGTQITPNES